MYPGYNQRPSGEIAREGQRQVWYHFQFYPLSMKLEELSAKLTNKHKADQTQISLAIPAGEVKITCFYLKKEDIEM